MFIAIRSFSGCLLGLCVLIIIIFLLGLVIQGGAWLGGKILPWLSIIMWLVLTIDICLVLPLCLFRAGRRIAGMALQISSYLYGLILWIWAFLLAYTIWGVMAVIIGLVIVGVGVVPIALLATAFAGDWKIFGELILLLVLTFGSRFLGLAMTRSAAVPPSDSWVEEIRE